MSIRVFGPEGKPVTARDLFALATRLVEQRAATPCGHSTSQEPVTPERDPIARLQPNIAANPSRSRARALGSPRVVTGSVTPRAYPTPTDADLLDDLVFDLFCRLSQGPVTGLHLARLTFTAPRHCDLRAMLHRVAADAPAGGFFVLAEKRASTDGHGLLLTDTEADPYALAERYLAREGLKLGSVNVDDVPGWNRFRFGSARLRLLKDLRGIAQYDLKILDHADKRVKEVPVAAFAWGAFAGAEPLAAFAFSDGLPAKRMCRWCRQVELRPGQADDSGCSDRCRQEKSRTERRNRSANVGPEPAERTSRGAKQRKVPKP